MVWIYSDTFKWNLVRLAASKMLKGLVKVQERISDLKFDPVNYFLTFSLKFLVLVFVIV